MAQLISSLMQFDPSLSIEVATAIAQKSIGKANVWLAEESNGSKLAA